MAADPVAPSVHPRVCVANISRGQVGIPLVGAVIGGLRQGGEISRLVLVESGPYLDDGRNRAIRHALAELDDDGELAWDWLLFIDSDMQFQPADIATLLSPYSTSHASIPDLILDPHEHPVIGGFYVNPYNDGRYPEEHRVGPVVYNWQDEGNPAVGDETDFKLIRMSTTSIEELPGSFHPSSPLLRVSMIGTGFLAIHISLIREMAELYGEPCPWFDEPIVNGMLYGEDMGFAFRVMEMDYPVLLNRACRIAHNKTITLTPPDHLAYQPATPTGA